VESRGRREGGEGKEGGKKRRGERTPFSKSWIRRSVLCMYTCQKLRIWETGIFWIFFGRRAAGDFCEFKTGIPGGPGRRGLCDADVTLQIVRAMFPETLQSTVVSTTVYCRKTNGNPISGPHLSKSCEILHLGTREAPIFTL